MTTTSGFVAAHLKQGAALHGLVRQQRRKADHRGAAVKHFSAGGEGPKSELFLALLDQWDQACGGEEANQEEHRPRDGRELGTDCLAGSQLSSQRSNEAKHCQTTIDDLGSGAGKGHGVSRGDARGLRCGRRWWGGCGRGLILRHSLSLLDIRLGTVGTCPHDDDRASRTNEAGHTRAHTQTGPRCNRTDCDGRAGRHTGGHIESSGKYRGTV
mmetsp:Transcript_27724/g.69862  ORF Transcript_27724/g.69862 Transcript_27724/m.69862 type:complete len:213 (+) Transcript_27724:141-779(+)